TRNAVIALFRIGMTPEPKNGTIELTNINDGRQISEPGAQVQFTNRRTHEKTVITLDNQGTFAPDTRLSAKAGDRFDVAVRDGINTRRLSEVAGMLTVPGLVAGTNTIDLVDPMVHKDELDAKGKPRFEKARYSGPWAVGSVSPEDVRQGQL